jgi:hypothetical protein
MVSAGVALFPWVGHPNPELVVQRETMIPVVRVWTSPDWSSPVQSGSSPSNFWTGIGPVQNSGRLVRAWSGPVHLGQISESF